MTVARLLAIRRMLFTLLDWVDEELRARGWRAEGARARPR